MRLYDQFSNTPIKPDSKKWMRPYNFLPDDEIEAILVDSSGISAEDGVQTTALIREACCGSETSASTAIEISKLHKHHTIYDSFRFDIDDDQELSLKSSSTLSTSSSLGQYRRDMLQPISVVTFEDSESISPGKSKTSSGGLNNMTIIAAKKYNEIPGTERHNKSASYLTTGSEEDASSNTNDEFFAPTLAYTQSSEEESSVWFDFQGFGVKNPFRALCEKEESSEIGSSPCHSTSPTFHKTLDAKYHFKFGNSTSPKYSGKKDKGTPSDRSPNMNKGTANYAKYHNMLIDGYSVFEVSKVMEKDSIDPSIVSLVLAASRISHDV
eukprot:jgi/Psemu1/4927/gm1.4927_g